MMKVVWGLAGVLLFAACGEEGASAIDEDGIIDREVFVQTYVELRMESFDNIPRVITDGERDVILEERGVSAEELRLFLTVHGPDVEFMRDLWAEIEGQILNLLNPEPDSLDGEPSPADGSSN